MSTTSTQQQQGTSTTNPWAPQAAALTTGFNDAGTALGQAQQAQAPTNFTAGLTPQQLQTYQMMVGAGNNQATPGAEAAAGNNLIGSGTGAADAGLYGLSNFNPTTNNSMGGIINGANNYAAGVNIPGQVAQAMQGANETARDVTNPGINANAALTGNINSSTTGNAQGIVDRGLAEQAGNLGATLENQAYGTGAGLASSTGQSNNASLLAALQGASSGGTGATGAGVSALGQSVGDTGNLYSLAAAGGGGLQAGNQADLTNQLQQFQSGVSSPFAALQNYMGVVGGQNWGGTTNSSGTTTSTPSMLSTIGALLGAGGSAAKGASSLAPMLAGLFA